MRCGVFSLMAMGAFAGVIAAPQANSTFLGTLPGERRCATPTATLSTTLAHIQCIHACIKPTSVCSPGEPTGQTTTAPPVLSTIVQPFACIATVNVWDNPGCNHCATCTSATSSAQETTLPGERWCPTPTTVSTTVYPTSAFCRCPSLPAECPSGGHLTTVPLPTATLTEGCTVSVVAGPGDCSNVCSICA